MLFYCLMFTFCLFAQKTPEVKISGIGVYPNPFNEKIFIESDNKLEKIEIYSENGLKILSVNQTNIVDANEIQKGKYILKLFFKDQIIIRKVYKN